MKKIVLEKSIPTNIEKQDLNKLPFLEATTESESYSHANFRFTNQPLIYFIKKFRGKEIKITIEEKY